MVPDFLIPDTKWFSQFVAYAEFIAYNNRYPRYSNVNERKLVSWMNSNKVALKAVNGERYTNTELYLYEQRKRFFECLELARFTTKQSKTNTRKSRTVGTNYVPIGTNCIPVSTNCVSVASINVLIPIEQNENRSTDLDAVFCIKKT